MAQNDTAVLTALAEKLDVDIDTLRASVSQDVVAETPAKKVSLKKAAAPKPAPVPFKQQVDEAVVANGYTFHSGRTYTFTALIEAQARALSSKKPSIEIVQSPTKDTVTAAVVVVRQENGVVYAQNLKTA